MDTHVVQSTPAFLKKQLMLPFENNPAKVILSISAGLKKLHKLLGHNVSNEISLQIGEQWMGTTSSNTEWQRSGKWDLEYISLQRSGKETPPPPYSRQVKTAPAEDEKERLAAYLPVRGPDDPPPPLPVFDALPVRDHGADGDSVGTGDDITSGFDWKRGPGALFSPRRADMTAAMATLKSQGPSRGARSTSERATKKALTGRGITRLLDTDLNIAPAPTPSSIAPATARAPSRVLSPGPSGDKLSKYPKYSRDLRDWELSGEGSDGEIPYANVIRVPNPVPFSPAARGRARGSHTTAEAGPVREVVHKMNPTRYFNAKGRIDCSRSTEAGTSGVSSQAESEIETTSPLSEYEHRDKWWAPLFTG
ncbi:uncharacterized protein LOC142498138 [Ascaphus truei]|uniref:uncharacterized protein LOC142498138 n=1 Tax=Ascaphus truei TaxID=8439 RepID=UPI003F5A310D